MITNYLWAIIGPLITLSASYVYKPSMLDCAHTSHLVYHEQQDLNPLRKDHGLSAYHLVSDIHKQETGMRVCAFKLTGTNNIIVAYRGTDLNNSANLLIDLGIAASILDSSDANSYFVAEHAQSWLEKHASGLLHFMNNHKEFVRYLPTNAALTLLNYCGYDLETAKKYKRLGIAHAFAAFAQIKKENPGCTFYITGHSLGGFYAQMVAYHHGLTAYTFNAPGAYQTYRQLYPEWTRALWWIRSKKLITNYVREHDLVGTFGTHLGQIKIIPNVQNGPKNNQILPGYNDTLWLIYDLTEYARRNHSMAQVVEHLVSAKANH